MRKRLLSLGLAIALVISLLSWVAVEGEASDYECAWFPAPAMNLTQIAYESYSHGSQNAIDMVPGGTVFAPFTGQITYKDSKWGYVVLQSTDKVRYADGTIDYMTATFMHDENISDLFVGQTITQGTGFYHAGGMGNGNANAYGDHVHLSVYKGKASANSGYGSGNIYAYNAFYINPAKTTKIVNKGVKVSGNTVGNGAPTNWSNLWKNLEEADDHVDESYPCNGLIEITSNTSYVKSMPCSEKTDPKSTNVESEPAVKGDWYDAIGLVRNDAGNLWYRVEAKNGKTGYIYAGDTKYLASETDLDLDGETVPTEIKQGNGFSVKGIVSTKYRRLRAVHVFVEAADKTWPSYTQKRVEIDATSYDLSQPEMDYSIKFDQLPVGTYTYVIWAEVRSCYAKNGTEWAYTETDGIGLLVSPFTVVKSAGTTTTHTLTFVANGGSCDTSTKKVVAGQKIGTLPTAGHDELYFEGWYTAPFGGGTQITADTVASKNMTLYAHYSYMGEKIHFDANGGTLPGAVLTDTIDYVNNGRPGESLVIFNQSGTQPGTNTYGKEVAVNSQGKITAVREYGDTKQLTVPSGGFILSGQQGWDSSAGVSTGGAMFVKKIIAMEEAYVSFNYETGEVKVFDSYAGYLAETKRGREYTTLGVLPVPTRNGYVFEGWESDAGKAVNYYSGFSGINLTASWSEEDSIYPEATLEYGGHYYELYDNNVTWTEAKRICEEKGGYLTAITTSAEQKAIVELMAEGSRGLYRIGATDAESEGKWKWVNGEAFSYSNWDKSHTEPSNGDGENYAAIIAIENPPNKQVGEWVDDRNVSYGNFYDISNSGFICEYDRKVCKHTYKYTIQIVPTTTAAGSLKGTCSSCAETVTVTMPKLNTGDYSYQITEQPSYTATGTGRYTWKTTTYGTYSIEVILDKLVATLSKIAVAKMPTKTEYRIGESLDTTGLTLTATYSDGSTKTVSSGFTTSGFDSTTAGTKSVTVTWQGKRTAFAVTVVEDTVIGDMDGNDKLDVDDAIYLLLHVMFGAEDYPVATGMHMDMDGNGKLDIDDAIYLLLHVMFGAEDYPL